MPRWVVPGWFVAYGAELVDAAQAGLDRKLLEQLKDVLAKRADHQPPEETGAPFALRWTTVPTLGFPRAPFEVWRRRRAYKVDSLRSTPLAVTTQATFTWPGGMYLVGVQAEPDPGAALVVRPLDVRGKALPGQRLEFAANGGGILYGPGIVGVSVTGRGRLTTIAGIEQNGVANASGWTRIDTVGFPVEASEVAAPVYDPRLQGFEPASLSGVDAAKLRLAIAAFLHLPPPTIGASGVPTPAWTAVDPGAYLALLRAAHPSPLSLVLACLTASDDTDPARIQALYTEAAAYPGLRQADLPGATPGEDATFDLPVVGTTMLATSSDSAAATGLGYGTIDLPPRLATAPLTHATVAAAAAASSALPGWDYMVTASFTVPFFGTLDLAALAQPSLPPDAVANLTASAFGANRPPTRDTAASESVTLGWDLTARPQSFGVVASDAPGSAEVLNTPRPAGVGGYFPFVPQRPATIGGDPPAGARTTYVDAVSPVPLSGSHTTSYFVIGLDVFDRWSTWGQTTHTATAPAVTAPGLHEARLELNAGAAVGKVVPATLVVDVSWDWADRTPDRIELYGKFFPAASTAVPDPTFTGGLQTSPAGAIGAPAVVRFDTLGNPTLQAPYAGSVETLALPPPATGTTPPPTASAEVRTYRVHLQNVSCDFTTVDELAHAVTARGAESVRSTVLSAVVGPKVARAANPLPSNPPTLPVDVLWTALPDAAGRARAVLTWPAVAGAAGYFVWEATEGALLAAVGQAPPPRGTPILTRASTLRTAITGSGEQASLQAFSRMNERKLTGTSIELALPGAADTLYAYRVSSVTSQGVESARSSTVALAAVPRRNQPGTPKLSVRARRDGMAGIEAVVVPGPEPAAAGFRLHRVRSSALAENVGSMGPAKVGPADTGWAARQVPSLVGPSDAGFAILDAVSESWYPYYYRAVAIGTQDLASGQYAGESAASAAQWAVLAPSLGPTLAVAAVTANSATRLVRFTTDLPVRETPVGRASIVVVEVALAPDGRSTQRTPVLAADPAAVAVAPALTLASSAPAAPQINRRAPTSGGTAEYTVLLDAAVAAGVVVVTDPLGRSAERPF